MRFRVQILPFFKQRNYGIALTTQHGDMSYDISRAICTWKEMYFFLCIEKFNSNPHHCIFTCLVCRRCLALQCDIMV